MRILPVAAILLASAPCSMLLVDRFNTKVVVFAGMACVTAGFAFLASASATDTYADVLPGLMLLGLGAGLAFAPSTDAVMGSLPPTQTGVGAGTNSAALQTGGAMGVAVLGSLLNARYQGHMESALAGHHVPSRVMDVITGSLGGALGVAARVGGTLGEELASAGRAAFLSGMDLALTVGAVVAGVAALGVLALLPPRAERSAPKAESPRGSPPAPR